MISLLLLLLFPVIWPFIAKIIWSRELTGVEHAMNIGAGVLVVLLGFGLSLFRSTYDTQVLNGRVLEKRIERVTCRHTYDCNCRKECSGTGENRSCHRVCDTCREHSSDFDHDLKTTLGTITIDRVDRQGKKVPPRFEKAQAGDPVAKTSWYTNYIKAAPDSLFNKAQNSLLLEQYAGKLPAYPTQVYDYHYVDRVLPVGVNVPDLANWNRRLADSLRDLGAAKQVNVVIVITNEANPIFANALEAHWLGGKKNDVLVVLGSTAFPARTWARVISWTDSHVFKIELRDALNSMETFTADGVVDAIAHHVAKSFVRKSMEDFKYLQSSVEPPAWLLALLFVLSASVSIGCTVFLIRNEERVAPHSKGW